MKTGQNTRNIEAQGLLSLLEEITETAMIRQLSDESLIGVRAIIHRVRSTLQQSEAPAFVETSQEQAVPAGPFNEAEEAVLRGTAPSSTSARAQSQVSRKDLRASLEKFVER